MDKLDNVLLGELMKNSRTPITRLAKRLKVSREVAGYRLKKLIDSKVILKLIAEIDESKLGYIGAAIFINVKATRQKEFKEFLANSPFVSWVAELSGIWNFGFSITAKSNEELDTKFLLIYNVFKNDILNHRFTLHKKSSFFYEKYFNLLPEVSKKLNFAYKTDYKDIKILEELSKNSRIDIVSLAKKINLTGPAVSQRVKQLEKSGYIKKYSAFLDISKLGLFQYSIFIVNKNIEDQRRLISYLSSHKNISFIAEYISDPFLEFGVFVDDPYKLRDILQEIEEKFLNTYLIEVSLFHKEFVSIGTPSCVFTAE